MKTLFRLFIAGTCLMLAFSCGQKTTESLSEPAGLIPAPVEMIVNPGSISSNDLAKLPKKVKVSEKALLRRLEGQSLTDWQLKSAYWMEVEPKTVKIEAADQQGVYYARQSLKMMEALNSTVACCRFACACSSAEGSCSSGRG